MRRFIFLIIRYSIALLVLVEITIRAFSLTNDVPMRKINEFGLQVFKENQSGYYEGFNWKVNSDGFLGHNDKSGDNQILLIGDSFVENIMNPFSCRQSSLFKDKGYQVFEAGRSGMTFIETLEFNKHLKPFVSPLKSIFIIDNIDFYESITEIRKFNDRCQISILEKNIYKGEIKYKNLKKILYNYKTLYYLYDKFRKSRKTEQKQKKSDEEIKVNQNFVVELIRFAKENYDLNNSLFVFRNTNQFSQSFDELKLKYIELKISDQKGLTFENDNHWNCDGHLKAFQQIYNHLNVPLINLPK